MGIVRTILRRSLRRLGLERIHHPAIAELVIHEGIQTVLDIGANEGHYGLDLRERGYQGRIVSLEPVASIFEVLALRAKADPLWTAHKLAVGEEPGELPISVTAEHVWSSFKAPSQYTSANFQGVRRERQELVSVVRLEDFLRRNPEYLQSPYLKLDVQGYELEALKGLGDLLPSMCAVQLELPFRQIYEGQACLPEMIDWMSQRGFEIAMAKENGFDWKAFRLLELDVVFVRTI